MPAKKVADEKCRFCLQKIVKRAKGGFCSVRCSGLFYSGTPKESSKYTKHVMRDLRDTDY